MAEKYYEDDYVTLYHGDCLELADVWTGADVLVTDPPYGIGWKKGSGLGKGSMPHEGIQNDQDTSARDSALQAWGQLKPWLVFGAIKAAFPNGWERMLVFEKPRNSGIIGTRIPWTNNWEPVFLGGKWPDQVPSRSAIIRTAEPSAGGYSGYASRAGHPHTKPQDVMTRLLEAVPPGVIADPFAGSGSTLLAARNLGRKVIGVELEEKYCEVIVKRLSQQAFDFSSLEAS